MTIPTPAAASPPAGLPAEGGLTVLLETQHRIAFAVFATSAGQTPTGLLLLAPAAGLYTGTSLDRAMLRTVRGMVDGTARRLLWPARGLYVDCPAAALDSPGRPAGDGIRWVPAGREGRAAQPGLGQAVPRQRSQGQGHAPPAVVAVAAGDSFRRIATALAASAAGAPRLGALLKRVHDVIVRLVQPGRGRGADALAWTTEYSCAAHQAGSVRALLAGAGFSRGLWRQIAREGYLIRNGTPVHALDSVAAGDEISVLTPPRAATAVALEPGSLNIHYEDTDLLVVDKPAGMLVHPARSVTGGTLANRVAAHLAAHGCDATPRPVGRLDRGTSGLIAFAKTRHAQQSLIAQHRSGTYRRTYLAITGPGELPGGIGGRQVELDARVVSPPRDPERYPVARQALTRVKSLAAYTGGMLVQAQPATGRTHQIRQHLAGAGLGLWGDREYGVPLGAIDRPALHAWRLAFNHPLTGAPIEVRSPLPDDMRELLRRLRAGRLPE